MIAMQPWGVLFHLPYAGLERALGEVATWRIPRIFDHVENCRREQNRGRPFGSEGIGNGSILDKALRVTETRWDTVGARWVQGGLRDLVQGLVHGWVQWCVHGRILRNRTSHGFGN